MTDYYQLSTQINDVYQRLAALEAQVATLSSRLGVPFTGSASGVAFGPRLSTALDPRAMDSAGLDPAAPPRAGLDPAAPPRAGLGPAAPPMGFDPLAPVPPPAPDPLFGVPPAGAQPVGMPADPRMAGLTPEVVADLVRRGKKIQAIKLYRELTNLDLKTAKDVIDSL